MQRFAFPPPEAAGRAPANREWRHDAAASGSDTAGGTSALTNA